MVPHQYRPLLATTMIFDATFSELFSYLYHCLLRLGDLRATIELHYLVEAWRVSFSNEFKLGHELNK